MATAEVKLRTLAAANAGLQAFLGSPPNVFRWWDTQHVQGSTLPGVTARRISTATDYRMTGRNPFDQPRFQLDVRAADPEVARSVAKAVLAFLDTLNLAVTGGTVTGKQAPCFVLNQRAGMDFQLNPPVFVQSIDVRMWNLEE